MPSHKQDLALSRVYLVHVYSHASCTIYVAHIQVYVLKYMRLCVVLDMQQITSKAL